MKAVLGYVVLFLSILHYNDGAKILGVFPFPAPSHYMLGSTLMKGLAEAGHDVTMVSPFVEKNPPEKGTYTEVVLDDIMKDMVSKYR